MPVIVNPSASYNWTLTRERICDKALEKCSRLSPGEQVASEDRSLCLEALDGILKNLLWRGYRWPKIASGATTLTFSSGVQSQSLPQDFYDIVQLNYVDGSGNETPFKTKLTTLEWDLIPLKTTQAAYPDRFYIDNANTLFIYPVTNQTVTGKLYYQKVIDNSVAQSSVTLDSPWLLGLVYGVAAEVGPEFGVDPKKIAFFEAKWERQLNLGVMNEGPRGPDRIQVSD